MNEKYASTVRPGGEGPRVPRIGQNYGPDGQGYLIRYPRVSHTIAHPPLCAFLSLMAWTKVCFFAPSSSHHFSLLIARINLWSVFNYPSLLPRPLGRPLLPYATPLFSRLPTDRVIKHRCVKRILAHPRQELLLLWYAIHSRCTVEWTILVE